MAIKRMSVPVRPDKETNNSGESKAAAALAPLEEKEGAERQPNPPAYEGKLAINTGPLKLPQNLTEEEEKVKRFLPADPFVLGVLCFSLLFILAIAYIVWSGWEPPK